MIRVQASPQHSLDAGNPVPVVLADKRHAFFIPHNGRAKKPFVEEMPEMPKFNRISHRPTVQIQELVSLTFGIHPSTMTGPSRTQAHTWPRMVAMYLTRELTNRSLPSIGKSFGARHHTTVLHALREVERRIAANANDREAVDTLRKVLEG